MLRRDGMLREGAPRRDGGMLRYARDVAASWPGVSYNPPAAGLTETYETPARQPVREGDVVVPALQALLSGVFAGVVCAGIVTGLTVWARWRWYVPLISGMAVCAVVAAATWFNLLEDTRRLLRRVETYVTDAQQAQQAQQAQPTQPAQTLRVELADNPHGQPGRLSSGERMAWFDLPCTEDQARAIATAVLAGTHKLTRHDVSVAGQLSDQKARDVLAALEGAGMTRSRGHDPSGAELTAAGRAMFAQLAEGD